MSVDSTDAACRFADLSEEPSLAEPADALVTANLPEFMSWESPGNWRWHRVAELFPAYQLCALDGDGRITGAVNGLPLRWNGDPASLPGGYDDVVTSVVDGDGGRGATHTCLLSVSIAPEARGRGLAETLLALAGERARARGHRGLVVPLRPTAKHHYPLIPISRYTAWRTPEGRPFDPWLRLHLAAGASVVGWAESSLVISQPASRWERLTGLAMPGPGAYLVPGALAPVECDERGVATYREPNIWVLHPAGPSGRGGAAPPGETTPAC